LFVVILGSVTVIRVSETGVNDALIFPKETFVMDDNLNPLIVIELFT
jgi:hypothetical protein